tara:strand:- start:273 stop:521 length:249 start_codon:yes stop_codon:yes gene_type:complete
MKKTMTKYLKLKMQTDDYAEIARAFTIASQLLIKEYPESKRKDKESYNTKQARKENYKLAQKLVDAYARITKYAHQIEYTEE